MTTFTREGKKILVIAVFALLPGKAVVQVTAIKITIDDLLEIGTEESVGPLKPFLVALDIEIGDLNDSRESMGWGINRRVGAHDLTRGYDLKGTIFLK